MGYPCTIYSWPTPAIKGRSSLQKGRSLSTADQHQLKRWERSYSTAGQHQLLRGEQKKLRPAQPPTPPPPISHFTTWKEPLCYTCPPCEGRTFSTAGQHQLRKGGPCLQLINTSLKGEILTSSKRDLVYSWSTPALQGRTCATPPPPSHFTTWKEPLCYTWLIVSGAIPKYSTEKKKLFLFA